MKSRWLALLLGLVALIILLVVGVICYQAATLKSRLAESLGKALGARVEVTSLSLDLWKGELHAAGIKLTNERTGAPWDGGEISQAVIHFHLGDLFAARLPVSVEVSSWRITLHPSSPSAAAPSDDQTPTAQSSPTRNGVVVTQLAATEGEVEIDLAGGRQTLIHGVSFQAVDNGGDVWTTHLQATGLDAGPFVAGSSSVELRSEADELTFSSLRLQCAGGMITGDGKVGLKDAHPAEATLKAVDVPMVMLVAVKWQMKLSGLVTGNLTYKGDDLGAEARGHLSVDHGKFNILPFLGKMAALVGLPDISGVEVDQATTDFDWQDRVLHLTAIDVRKNDVTRIAGEVDVGADQKVDGRLKLGLPNAILARWPQLQTEVFSVPLEDYGWADVHLTGTPDHLQEDLSPRVLAAGIQGGNGLINAGAQKAMDLLKGILGN